MPSVETGCWWDEASGFLSSQNWNDDWQEKTAGVTLALRLWTEWMLPSQALMRGVGKSMIQVSITISPSLTVHQVPRSCGPSDCQKLSVLPSLNCSTPRFKNHSETASQLIPTGPTKQASASRWISTDLKKNKKKRAVENGTQREKKNGKNALYVDVRFPNRPDPPFPSRTIDSFPFTTISMLQNRNSLKETFVPKKCRPRKNN